MQEGAQDLFQEGREDPPHTLQDRLPTAPARYAQGALLNPEMNVALALVMLRNSGLTGPILRDIGERFRRSDEIKLALVTHPTTPHVLSMQMVKFCHWRDLLGIAGNRRLPQPLRALAEQTLGERMNQLPSTEQARLARNASRGIVIPLLRSRNPRVIQELMLNPRLVERDVVQLARDRNVPAEVLANLARSGPWQKRSAVRDALIENDSTPIAEAVKLVILLSLAKLKELLRNPRLRTQIRTEAKRVMRQAPPK